MQLVGSLARPELRAAWSVESFQVLVMASSCLGAHIHDSSPSSNANDFHVPQALGHLQEASGH